MKVFFLTGLVVWSMTALGQQAYYDVTAGNGNGIRFWQNDAYKIHMGNTAEYQYGPVLSYSMKFNMSSDVDRGWTWGIVGLTPVAALSNLGNMQIAGSFIANKIGIGKSSPAGALDINAGGNYAIRTLTSSRYVIEVRNTSDVDGGWWLVNDPDGRFAIHENSVGDKFTIKPGGNVGIGTSSPVSLLDVNGRGRFRRFGSENSGLIIGGDALTLKGWGTNNPYIEWINSDETRQGYFGWNTNRLSLVLENGNNFTIENGNVGVGTTTPNEKLTVNGTVYGKEVKVDLAVPAPDYVFADDYKLRTVEELQHYIASNGHLPEVPSSTQMTDDGVKLGEMNMILLKKVEELTLYLIDVKNENSELRKQNEELRKEVLDKLAELEMQVSKHKQ